MSKTKSIVILTVLAILIAFFGAASFVQFEIPNSTKDYMSIFGTIGKGIDLEGGYYAVLTPKDGETATSEEYDAVIETLRSRLDENGYTEATITRQDNGLRVEIPAIDNPDDVMQLIGDQGELQFRDSKGNVKVRGEHVADARSGYDQNGDPTVYLEFTTEGAKLFASATKAMTSKQSEYLYMWTNDAAAEIIWRIGFTPTSYGGSLGSVFLKYNQITFYPDYVPADWALGLYASADLRYNAFFSQQRTGYAHGLSWPLLVKYYGNETFIQNNIYHVNMPKVLRLSEQYLIRAEAYCRKADYSKAAKDITKLRTARYSSYGNTTISADNWLETISEERVKELYMEGFRLQDLKRWHKGFERKEQTSCVKEGSTLKIEADNPLFVWPIPQHELNSPDAEIQPNESNR